MNCPNWVSESFRSKLKLKSNPESPSQFQLYGLQFPRCYAGLHQTFYNLLTKLKSHFFLWGIIVKPQMVKSCGILVCALKHRKKCTPSFVVNFRNETPKAGPF